MLGIGVRSSASCKPLELASSQTRLPKPAGRTTPASTVGISSPAFTVYTLVTATLAVRVMATASLFCHIITTRIGQGKEIRQLGWNAKRHHIRP